MKILKTLYTATLCAAMAVSTSSCLNSWLDQSPADGIDAETAIKNSDDLANVRTGLYAAVKGNSSLINYYGRLMFVYGDMRGEDIQYEYNGGSGRANFYYYMEYTTADNFTTSTAVWQMPYVVIARANRLIQAAESGNLTDAAEAKATIDQYDAEAKEVIAPTFRHDLFRIADLAEEVARFYGYDNIPTTLPSGEATTGKLSFKLRVEQVARDIAEFCGFSQGMTYSFESPKVFDKLLLPEDSDLRKAIPIMNPLGEDYSIMRTSSLNGMLTSLATNYNRRNKDVKLYELANIYLPKALPLTELPDERVQFTLGMYGEGDFFTMKGVVEEFFDKVGLHKKEKYDPNAGKSFLHPGRQANIIYDGVVVGYLGEVHPEVADNYGIGTRAYIAVIDMPEIVARATFDRKYTGIAKFPAVTRDISMVMPKEILVGQVEEVIEKKGGAYLESYALFDLYEGAQIKEGYKSVAYSIVFRAKDKTLEEAEISQAMEKILAGLEELGIELRK